MKNPLISIIVPVYNVEHYIADCIDSIVSQSYKRLELILVDDGSSDNSFAICKKYSQSDSRIKLMTVNRGGVSVARNLGKDYAKGDYVLFVDSDDVLLPDALMHYVDNVNRTNADIIKSGWEAHYYDGRIKQYIHNEDVISNDCSEFFTLLQKTIYDTYIWNTLFKREIIADLKFDVSLCWLEDHIFSLQCIIKGNKFSLIKHITYRYIIRRRISLSSNKDPYMICKAANIQIRYKQIVLRGKNEEQLRKEWVGYHQMIDKAIRILYEGHNKYYYRKLFNKEVIRASELLLTSYEKIFFHAELPFVVIDSYLLFKTRMLQLKSQIKSTIKNMLIIHT